MIGLDAKLDKKKCKYESYMGLDEKLGKKKCKYESYMNSISNKTRIKFYYQNIWQKYWMDNTVDSDLAAVQPITSIQVWMRFKSKLVNGSCKKINFLFK